MATTAGKAAELREKQAQLEVAREQVGRTRVHMWRGRAGHRVG